MIRDIIIMDFLTFNEYSIRIFTVRPQSDSNTYLSTSNMQQSLEKSQIFQTNSQQNGIRSCHNKQPSLPHTSSKIGYSTRAQSSSLPYSTSRSSNQQYLSMCKPQDFKGPTSYNPQFSHSSVFLPLNIRESSKLPLFPSTSSRFLRSVSRTGKQLGGLTGGNEAIAFAFPVPETPSTMPVFRIDSVTNIEESMLSTYPFTYSYNKNEVIKYRRLPKLLISDYFRTSNSISIRRLP